jgi:hypothetical protein
MISGLTLMPSFCTSMAASKIARACMAEISGKRMPRRQPRRPSIGLNSCSSATRRVTFSTGTPSLLASSACWSCGVRQELVQGRIEEADGRGQAVERAEDAGEVAPLIGQQLGDGGFAAFLGVGQDHLAHRVDAVALEEHVLGAAEADALGAERHRVGDLVGLVRVGADLQAAQLVGPAMSWA